MADIIELIQQDHQEFRTLLSTIEDADPDRRGELFEQLVGELARHEAAEEALVHRVLRDEAAGGREVAEEVLEEESEAETALSQLEDMDPASPEFLEAFRSLRGDVQSHADHEEREEHPRLRDALTDDRRRDMAESWTRLKERGPTRPHPHTPQTPEVRQAVGPVAGIFDRARDSVRDVLSS